MKLSEAITRAVCLADREVVILRHRSALAVAAWIGFADAEGVAGNQPDISLSAEGAVRDLSKLAAVPVDGDGAADAVTPIVSIWAVVSLHEPICVETPSTTLSSRMCTPQEG